MTRKEYDCLAATFAEDPQSRIAVVRNGGLFFCGDRRTPNDEKNEPKSGSWRPAVVWQIADIMSYGQETRGFAAVTGG